MLIHITHRSISILSLLLIFGCGGPLVEVSVVDERTALENQILGSYEELDKEVLLLASVRSIDKTGKLVKVSKIPHGKRRVIKAIQRSSFNRDDIDRLKLSGIIGENNQGGMTLLEPDRVPKEQKVFVENLIKEENADREIIMKRVIETNENLLDEDLPKVRRVFASLNRDKAKPGEMIQLESGEWVKK